jgi:hypothetical protein
MHREMKQIVDAQIDLGMDDPISYAVLIEVDFLRECCFVLITYVLNRI